MELIRVYETLLRKSGRQNWWPARTPFEVVVGAILTQQTTWRNVEKAIGNLEEGGLLSMKRLAEAKYEEVERCVRPAGYYKQKAKRIRGVAKYLYEKYGGSLDDFFKRDCWEIRSELLGLNGIGRETADSILLYAGGKRVFVIDAYTRRFCSRFFGIEKRGYDALKEWFEERLPKDTKIYNEFHALLVGLGKNYCKKNAPACINCPLEKECMKRLES
ncbi:hypothetical protein HY991_01220 [Candidatus Micrarchaeota archaeon]|nr:hypothetical protein [Candidatus Micrarchaeota archaeon]